MIEWTNRFLTPTSLGEHEVFVFTTNAQGFHGAGAAGAAMRGDSKNTWRDDRAFLTASKAPEGSPLRVGHWAVYGVARGLQVGKHGRSYGVQTVTRPGAKKSITRRDIYAQLIELWAYAKANPKLTFLVPPVGEGYAGWSREEMNVVWEWLVQKHGLPENVTFIGRS